MDNTSLVRQALEALCFGLRKGQICYMNITQQLNCNGFITEFNESVQKFEYPNCACDGYYQYLIDGCLVQIAIGSNCYVNIRKLGKRSHNNCWNDKLQPLPTEWEGYLNILKNLHSAWDVRKKYADEEIDAFVSLGDQITLINQLAVEVLLVIHKFLLEP